MQAGFRLSNSAPNGLASCPKTSPCSPLKERSKTWTSGSVRVPQAKHGRLCYDSPHQTHLTCGQGRDRRRDLRGTLPIIEFRAEGSTVETCAFYPLGQSTLWLTDATSCYHPLQRVPR